MDRFCAVAAGSLSGSPAAYDDELARAAIADGFAPNGIARPQSDPASASLKRHAGSLSGSLSVPAENRIHASTISWIRFPWIRFPDLASRRAAYRALFDEVLAAEDLGAIRDATNGNYVLGSDRFRQQIAEMLGRRVTRGLPSRPRKSETR